MTPEETRRRLVALDVDQELPESDRELTFGELKEHFYAMQAEARTPAYIARVHDRMTFWFEQTEIRLITYRRFMAKGQYYNPAGD